MNDTDYGKSIVSGGPRCIFVVLVIEQKRDLERITVYEIALNNDRRDYQQDLLQNENVRKNFDDIIIIIFRFNLG